MNPAVRNILYSAVKNYGPEPIAHNARLCDAYLSDLLPTYPEERKLLVKGVAEGVPSKILLEHSSGSYKRIVSQFAGSSGLSAEMADEVVNCWRFALNDEFQRRSRYAERKGVRNYLMGIVSVLAILAVSSAIAVYRLPSQDTPQPAQQVVEQSIRQEAKTAPVISRDPLPELFIAEPSEQTEPATRNYYQASLSHAITEATIEPLSQAGWLKDLERHKASLAHAANEGAFYQQQQKQKQMAQPVLSPQLQDKPVEQTAILPQPVAPQGQQDETANPPKLAAEKRSRQQAQQREKALAAERLQQAEQKKKELAAKHLRQRQQAEQKEKERAATRLRQQARQKEQARKLAQQQQDKARKLHQQRLRQQKIQHQINTAQQLITQLTGISEAFGHNAAQLSKSQGDLKVLQKLKNLTQESYYQQHQQQVSNRINSLREKQAALSGSYVHRLKTLCKMPPQSISAGLRNKASDYGNKGLKPIAFNLLQQHTRRCSQVSRIEKNSVAHELSLAYGRVLR